MTTKQQISEWFDNGVNEDEEFMLIVCDTFDHIDYPSYVSGKAFKDRFEYYNGKNMQRIIEAYNLKMAKQEQLDQDRCMNKPE